MLALYCVIIVCKLGLHCLLELREKLISFLVVYGSVLPTVGFAEHKESC